MFITGSCFQHKNEKLKNKVQHTSFLIPKKNNVSALHTLHTQYLFKKLLNNPGKYVNMSFKKLCEKKVIKLTTQHSNNMTN